MVKPLQVKLKSAADENRKNQWEIEQAREITRENGVHNDKEIKLTQDLFAVIHEIRLRDPKLVEEAQIKVFGDPSKRK